MTKLRIACAQMDIVWENRRANFEVVRDSAKHAAAGGAGLLVLPEMFATGFSMNSAFTAEEENGETKSFLVDLAREFDIGVIGGYVRKASDSRGLNTAITIDRNGRVLAEYVKTHLFSFAGEDQVHMAGDGPVLFEMGGVRAACFICYDLRFPELFRLVAKDVDVVFVIASWPTARQRHWDSLLVARAIETQCYIVGVNRVGLGGEIAYTGGSVVLGPQGESLAKGVAETTLLMTELDTSVVSQTREQMPFLNDIRF